MSENILVVEYEPRYTDRVRQALTGQPFTMTFAKDGEEAIRALDVQQPKLIVLSSVVPKISTTELIRAIRGRKPLQDTPILLTVSGYSGKSPRADAQRVGASDILPKPYSEGEFLGKIQQMLGLPISAPLGGSSTVSLTPPGGVLTSDQIFGDLLDEKPATAGASAPRNPMSNKPTNDVDKLLADTLAGVMPQKKATPTGNVPKPVEAKPKTQPGAGNYDRQLEDTLSGLEKQARRNTGPGTTPTPAVPAPAPAPAAPPEPPRPAAAPAPAAPRFNTEKMPAYTADRVPVSQPVFPQAVAAPARVEEEEPTDGVKYGQYVLIEKIATGGMAEVWKARMRGVEGFQKIVAIKKILPHLSDNQDFIEMFVDEAKLAAQLNHNNIIHIYDLGKIQSSYYIAMEYIDGHDLKTIVKLAQERDNPLTVELALFVASKVAAALDYAHRKRDFEDKEMGIVHRDVSPQNVLISQEGDIKLCDFGIAKAASKASHTQAGALKGKLQYMSPEQAWGRPIDRRSDVFALAAVLFEMLSGRKLFTGDNELSILEQVREARVTAPSLYNDEVTPEIDKVVLKALQKDPANRYQSAGEMARDLDAILYSFKPTPASADLAIFMHRLSSESPAAIEPEPEPAPLPRQPEPPKPATRLKPDVAPVIAKPAVIAPPPAVAPPAAAAPPHAVPVTAAAHAPAVHHEELKPGKSPVGLIAAAAVVLLALGAGGWWMLKGKGNGAAAPPSPTTSAAAVQPGPNAAVTNSAPLTDTTGTLVALPGTAATSTTIDPSLVDAEVQKRLAAERERLLRQQQAAGQTTTAPARPVPVPTATQPQVAAVQPPPVQTQTVAPQPAPVQTQTVAPPPQTAQRDPEPAPVQQQPAPAPRVREGDLVLAGTEGLAAPKLLRRGSVTYPPVAKVQRVQGVVICNVLVSETGSVLEVRVLRGIPALNDAAQQTMRRSSFSPATKDGVRVKSWISVPVEFKL